MERILFFNALLVLVSGFAMLRGGGPERLTGAALLIAAIATRIVFSFDRADWAALEVGVMVVDLTLLAVLVATALYADRYWIFWLTALHALGTGAHLVKAIDPEILRAAYGILGAAWSYPILILLAVGTVRHRGRVRRLGRDVDWSRLGGG